MPLAEEMIKLYLLSEKKISLAVMKALMRTIFLKGTEL
jgi:hypothetical protein